MPNAPRRAPTFASRSRMRIAPKYRRHSPARDVGGPIFSGGARGEAQWRSDRGERPRARRSKADTSQRAKGAAKGAASGARARRDELATTDEAILFPWPSAVRHRRSSCHDAPACLRPLASHGFTRRAPGSRRRGPHRKPPSSCRGFAPGSQRSRGDPTTFSASSTRAPFGKRSATSRDGPRAGASLVPRLRRVSSTDSRRPRTTKGSAW